MCAVLRLCVPNDPHECCCCARIVRQRQGCLHDCFRSCACTLASDSAAEERDDDEVDDQEEDGASDSLPEEDDPADGPAAASATAGPAAAQGGSDEEGDDAAPAQEDPAGAADEGGAATAADGRWVRRCGELAPTSSHRTFLCLRVCTAIMLTSHPRVSHLRAGKAAQGRA